MAVSGNPVLQLAMQQGPSPGVMYNLSGEVVTIGRADDNSITIQDPQVSRYHAKLTSQRGGWVIEDLGSANGTFVNEQRITGPTLVYAGVTLRLGSNITFMAQTATSMEETMPGQQPVPAPAAAPAPAYASPPRPAAPKGGSRWPLVLLGLGGLLGLVVIGVLVFLIFFTRGEEILVPPEILVQRPPSGSHVTVGETTLIMGTARDEERITRVELWADGQLISARQSDSPEGATTFPFSLAWNPNAAGNHNLFARAYSADGRIGQSNVLALLAETPEQASQQEPEEQQVVEHIMEEPQTPAEVAQELGISLEDFLDLNPDLDPEEEIAAGSGVFVPAEMPGEGEEGGGEAPGDEGGAGDLGAGDVGPPAPADGMNEPGGLAGADEGCTVHLGWTDAGNEAGYRVYGRPPGGVVFSLLATLEANNNDYLHSVTVPGTWGFYIIAFNGDGAELATPPIEVTVAPGPTCPNPFPTVLAFDALNLNAPEAIEFMYCYASLADSPFERVPLIDGVFFTRAGTARNIAEHMAGVEARELTWHEGTPLPVEFRCLGWSLGWIPVLHDLGTFRNEHPPDEWDGRDLVGTGDSFELVYTINRVPADGELPTTDPTIPSPFNVHLNADLGDCLSSVYRDKPFPTIGDALSCNNNRSIAWNWTGDESHIHGFRVIMRSYTMDDPAGGSEIVLAETGNPAVRGVLIPPLPTMCNEAVEYSVVAYVYGRESPPSPDSYVHENPTCPAIMVVHWSTLTPHTIFDGDILPGAETYGMFMIGGMGGHKWKYWNSSPGPWTQILPGVTYNLSSMSFTGDTFTNISVYSIGDGDPLTLYYDLWDHDSVGDNDRWCQGWTTLPARSRDEWLAFDQDVTIDGDGPHGTCTVVAHIGGHEPLPPAAWAGSDLRNPQVLYYPDGSLILRFYNYGPTFLMNETLRLNITYERTRDLGGGMTESIGATSSEEVTVTVPVNTTGAVDLPYEAPVGWTTNITVNLEGVTFTDPNMADNEVSVSIDRE